MTPNTSAALPCKQRGGAAPRQRKPRLRNPLLIGVAVLAVLLAACTVPTPDGTEPLPQLKRAHFGLQAQDQAALVGNGQAQPVVEFTVEDTPPSIFVNWVVPDAQAAAFAAAIDLPPGFSLAKVRILDSDPTPQYWLSLNVYRVSGITTGKRAEWSTYVDDGSGTPRFMIIRARAAEGSLDPIGPLALPEPFSHALGPDDVITTSMKRTDLVGGIPVLTGENLFNSTVALPAPAERDYVVPTREWVAANDYIYWINGVNDRVFQNATAHSAPLISVDLDDVTLQDDSEFAPYLAPEPAHVLVYLDKIQFAISPWWNVTETDGLVNAATLGELEPLKASLYSGLLNSEALSILNGTAEPVLHTTVEGSPQSAFWHWRIPAGNLAAFEAAADLPTGLTLAPTRLAESDPAPEHWLTLEVRRVSGTENGVRADWSTYVDDGAGVRTLVLESRASFAALDPVNRFTDPYPVSHTSTGATLDTAVGVGPDAFTSSFVAPAPGSGPTELATREWVAANELRYWANGVADRVFHDSTVFEPMDLVDPAGVAMANGSQWAPYVAASADRVWVSGQRTGLVTNPWWHIPG